MRERSPISWAFFKRALSLHFSLIMAAVSPRGVGSGLALGPATSQIPELPGWCTSCRDVRHSELELNSGHGRGCSCSMLYHEIGNMPSAFWWIRRPFNWKIFCQENWVVPPTCFFLLNLLEILFAACVVSTGNGIAPNDVTIWEGVSELTQNVGFCWSKRRCVPGLLAELLL